MSYGSGYRFGDDTESFFRLSSPVLEMATTPTALPRPLRADARRNRDAIVQAARAIVADEGVEAQIHDVARRAGVGVGTVYRHFATKSELMGELLRICTTENAALAREADLQEDPWDAFAGLVRGACAAMAGDAAKRRVWRVASDEAFAYAHDSKQEMHDATAVVVDRAHAAGVLRADFTNDDMAGLMCGLAAVIDAGGPADWSRLVEFALDGLRTTA
jgi:AcrR family transcriptional regulator